MKELTDAEIDEMIAQSEANLKALEAKMEVNYQRGDQENYLNEQMFLSIWKETKERKPKTDDERRQILIDHGWTLGPKNEEPLA